jgi:hypothetical protein
LRSSSPPWASSTTWPTSSGNPSRRAEH